MEEKHTPDLMTDWYLREDVHGDKTLIYKRTGPNEILLIAQCFNEEITKLIARAPELLQQIEQLEAERSGLQRENTALRAFLVEMTEGSAYFEKKVETLFTQLNSLKTK